MAYEKPKPKVRPTEENAIKYAIEKIFRVGRIGFPYQNCLNCKFWDINKDLCGKYNSRPPTEIIVYSCPQYEDNEDIPF